MSDHKIKALAVVQQKLSKATEIIPLLAEERDALLFDLLDSDVSERRLAREAGVSRGAIYKAKKRRAEG